MAFSRDDEHQRGDVDDESTIPRYTIAQLFELLLTLAERDNLLNPNCRANNPCIDCLRCTIHGPGHEDAPAPAPAPASAASTDDPGDRRYWSNVSPGSSFMEAHLPPILPDPSLVPPSRLQQPVPALVTEESAQSEHISDVSTYFSSRASSPKPIPHLGNAPSRSSAPYLGNTPWSSTLPTNSGSAATQQSSPSHFSISSSSSDPYRTLLPTSALFGSRPLVPSQRATSSLPAPALELGIVLCAVPSTHAAAAAASGIASHPAPGTHTRAPGITSCATRPTSSSADVRPCATSSAGAEAPAPASSATPVMPLPSPRNSTVMKGKYRSDAVAPLRTVLEVSEVSSSRLTLPRHGSIIAPPAEDNTPSIPARQPSIPSALPVPAASPQVEVEFGDGDVFIAPDNNITSVWYIVTHGRIVGVFDNNFEAVASVSNISCFSMKMYSTRAEAIRVFESACHLNLVRNVKPA